MTGCCCICPLASGRTPVTPHGAPLSTARLAASLFRSQDSCQQGLSHIIRAWQRVRGKLWLSLRTNPVALTPLREMAGLHFPKRLCHAAGLCRLTTLRSHSARSIFAAESPPLSVSTVLSTHPPPPPSPFSAPGSRCLNSGAPPRVRWTGGATACGARQLELPLVCIPQPRSAGGHYIRGSCPLRFCCRLAPDARRGADIGHQKVARRVSADICPSGV